MDPVGTSENGSSASPSSSGPSAPTSAASALASAASSAATAESSPASGAPDTGTGSAPSGSTPPATGGVPATGQPSASAAETRGPVPYDRHEAAVRNAREQARKEVAQQFAWANGLDPERVQRSLALAQRLDQDPRSFAQQLVQELGKGDEPEEALPEPDLRADDGRTAYSAQQMTKWWGVKEKQLVNRLMGELKPIIEDHKRQQAQRQTEGIVAEGRKTIKGALEHARTLPHFKENEEAISKKMDAINPEVLNRVGIVAAMYMAYNAVLSETVLPNIESTVEKRLRETQQKQAHAAAGSVRPSTSQPSVTPAKPTNVNQLARHMEKLEREGIPTTR